MKRAGIHIILLLAMFVAVGAHHPAPIQPVLGTWQFKAPMPEARSGAAAVVLGNSIYVLGGRTINGTVSSRVDRYDPNTDSWEVVESMDAPRLNAASVVWDNRIVVIGGRGANGQALNTVEQYNPQTNTWTAFPGLFEAREGHSAALLGETMYVAGGSGASGQIYDSVEFYDPAQGAWRVSDQWELDFPRASFAMVSVNDSAFAIGGFNTFGPLGFVQRFHPGEGTASRQSINPARGGLAAVYKGDRVFALGGITSTGQAISTTSVYFPTLDSWVTDAPMNTARAQFPAVLFDNEVYVFGGEDASSRVIGTVEVFTTGIAPIAEDDMVITNEDEAVSFDVLENDSDPAGTSLEISNFSLPGNGSVSLSQSNGSLIYTPDQDFNGIDRFAYTIVNGEGSIATADVVITVESVNDPPAFGSSPVQTAITGMLYEYNVQVVDVDGPVVTISADALPGWLMLVDNGNGEAVVSGTPGAIDAGNHLVTLRGSDGIAEQVQSFFVTVVEGVPPAPTLLTPEDGAELDSVTVAFTWTDLGATSWDLQIATNAAFSDIVFNVSSLTEPMYEQDQLLKDTEYFWRARAANGAGTSDWSMPFSFITSNGVSTHTEDEIPPLTLNLKPPYPNPSAGVVWIEVDVSEAGLNPVELAIYDLRGRQVALLLNDIPPYGTSQFRWDGTNEWGQPVASGTYYVRMTHKDQQIVRSLVIIR